MVMMKVHVRAFINDMDCCLELSGSQCRLWYDLDECSMDDLENCIAYEGDIDGLQSHNPDVFAFLLENGYVKETP